MMRRLLASAVAALLALSHARSTGAQAPAADPLASARAELAASHYDSATALLQGILADTTASAGTHATAWIWLGVVHYYAGDDSATARAFRAALAIAPALDASGLERIDPALADMFRAARLTTRGAATVPQDLPPDPDAIHSCVPKCEPGLRRPILVRMPPRIDPTIPGSALLAQGGGSSLVIVQGTVNPLGHIETGSVRIVSATTRATGEIVEELLVGAEFRPGMLEGRSVRVTVQLRYECEREGTEVRCHFR